MFAIVSAAFEVYNELDNGLLEAIYQEAMEIELARRGVSFVAQAPLRIKFKASILKQQYAAGFMGYGAILVEIKALKKLTSIDKFWLLNDLKATGLRVELLIQFGSPSELKWKRLVH